MDRVDEILFLYEDDRVEMGDGGITKIKKLQGEFKKDPRLVKLFNEGKLYHYRTTIGAGGGPKDRKVYRGTKEELEKIMKQKNQYLMRSDKEVQKIIDDPKYKDYRRKDFRNEGILTRKETEREGVKFKNFGKIGRAHV